ncbi:MAG: hypothetical protein N3D85_05725 [Candidatus Bathyarchaeota archaeon]|nr:hypothetical protein [Candidatus Bathyarchaeota archaeon]
MASEESETKYPIRTLHEFLSEMSKEWRNFKRGALAMLVLLSISLLAFIPLFIRAIRLEWDIFAYMFLMGLAAFIIYLLRIMAVQYRFFRRWGHRMEQLANLEEKLMSEMLEENKS